MSVNFATCFTYVWAVIRQLGQWKCKTSYVITLTLSLQSFIICFISRLIHSYWEWNESSDINIFKCQNNKLLHLFYWPYWFGGFVAQINPLTAGAAYIRVLIFISTLSTTF